MAAATVKLEGVEECVQKLHGLRQSMQRRIIRAGTRSACQVGARHGKSGVPRRKGLLRKSLGWKLAKARAGSMKAVGVVGARKGFKRDGSDPTKYAHLVDQGVKPHPIAAKKTRLAFAAGGRTVVVPTVQHPGIQGRHFMRRIYQSGLGAMSSAFRDKVESELHKQAAKAKPSEVDDGA